MQTIQELQAQLANGSTTAEKLAQASLEKIESTKNLNAYISVLNDRALERAKESDKRRAEGKSLGALDGIPVAVKDNMCLTGTRTTAASKILDNFVAPYTATALEKLEAAGAIIVGKTNMDEFAMGSSNETSYYGRWTNPAFQVDPRAVLQSPSPLARFLAPSVLTRVDLSASRQPARALSV